MGKQTIFCEITGDPTFDNLELNLSWRFKASVPIHDKKTLFVLQIWSKVRFNETLFCNFIIVKYPLLMLCAIRVKDNKAWNNSGYANFFFAIREGLEMLFSQFSKFEFFNFKMTFSKTNQPTFFIRLSKIL